MICFLFFVTNYDYIFRFCLFRFSLDVYCLWVGGTGVRLPSPHPPSPAPEVFQWTHDDDLSDTSAYKTAGLDVETLLTLFFLVLPPSHSDVGPGLVLPDDPTLGLSDQRRDKD